MQPLEWNQVEQKDDRSCAMDGIFDGIYFMIIKNWNL